MHLCYQITTRSSHQIVFLLTLSRVLSPYSHFRCLCLILMQLICPNTPTEQFCSSEQDGCSIAFSIDNSDNSDSLTVLQMGNLCCESEVPNPKGDDTQKLITSHKEPLTLDVDVEATAEQVLRHTVVSSDRRYKFEDFDTPYLLGKGGFATVYLAELKENKRKGIDMKYAMKQIPKKRLFERRVVENLKIERQVLADIKSPFIIELSFAFQDKQNCYFVMEYASGGDVYSFLNSSACPGKVNEYKKLGEEAPRFILATVVLALEELHRKSIMYRDLKPENVLVFENGYTKLADFGLAKKNENEELSKTMAGTKIYFAPEIMQKQGHNKNVDFWTLGIFLHELILFQPPFDHSMIVKTKFIKLCIESQKKRDWKGGAISNQAKDMINSFLRVDPSKRLGANGFDEIKQHAFFKDFDWAKLQRLEMVSPLKDIVKKYPMALSKAKEGGNDSEANDGDYDNIGGISYAPTNLK